MADKPADSNEKESKGPKAMALVRMVCFVLVLLTAGALIVGAYDFGIFDLRPQMSMAALGILPVFLISATMWGLANARVVAAQLAVHEHALAVRHEQIDHKIETAQAKFDDFLGEAFKELKAENESLKSEFERLKQLEREKLEEENSFLKEQNSLLKEQIASRSNGAAQRADDGDQIAVADEPAA